jgi:hypothetical protein
MTHATPSPLAVAPPLEEPAPPLPPPPLGVQTVQFVLAHSPTATLAFSHAVCEPPPEPESQLEQKLEYCELHLLSTQLMHSADPIELFCAAAQVELLLSELLQPSPLKPPIKAKQRGISFFMWCILVGVQRLRATLPRGIGQSCRLERAYAHASTLFTLARVLRCRCAHPSPDFSRFLGGMVTLHARAVSAFGVELRACG